MSKKSENVKIIISELNECVVFPAAGKKGTLLAVGHLNGAFGTIRNGTVNARGPVWENNLTNLLMSLKNNCKVTFIVPNYVGEYLDQFFTVTLKEGWFSKQELKRLVKIERCKDFDDNSLLQKLIDKKNAKMKFDNIIQNPPYNGSLHLDFLEKGLDLLTPGKGRMVIIEPATFFIDLRKWGKRGILGRTNSDDILKYDKVKNALRGHIVCASLDNLNKPFGTSLQFPFVTTVIDMSKTCDEFVFTCFGERRIVKDPYDCNLIGDYNTIWSIFDKVLGRSDILKNHITDKNMGQGICYTKYIQMNPYVGCIINDGKHDRKSIEKYGYVKNNFGEYLKSYFSGGYFKNMFSENDANQIYDSIPKKLANGATYARPKYSDKNCECVYASKEELENWEYNLFNTKLMIFICLALTIDQNNHLKDFLPFLVKKKYTDEEINKLFGFTDEEISLIDRTIKKYERNSPWFKRYMCGPDSVSDKEVNNFIKSL